jgi:membrane-associated phospholipid phosphatase
MNASHAHRHWRGATIAVVAAFVGVLSARHTAYADVVTPSTDSSQPARPHDVLWSHSNAWDYSLAGVGAAVLVVELGVLQPIRPPLRWTGPILFDTDVRNALRASDEHTRHNIEFVGWALWGAQLAWPVLVDVPYAWSRYSYAMARDLFWQDAMTLTLAGAVDGALRDLVGRARPGVYDCLSQGGANCLDANPDTTRSFPGGHIVNSTAASVLTCTQHYYMRLYGGPWDGVACATTLASDLTLAVLRIVSDNHWVSDQIAGVAIGGLIGWGAPYVMHFRRGARVRMEGDRPANEAQSPSGALVVPMPIMVDHGAGLGLAGIY